VSRFNQMTAVAFSGILGFGGCGLGGCGLVNITANYTVTFSSRWCLASATAGHVRTTSCCNIL